MHTGKASKMSAIQNPENLFKFFGLGGFEKEF